MPAPRWRACGCSIRLPETFPPPRRGARRGGLRSCHPAAVSCRHARPGCRAGSGRRRAILPMRAAAGARNRIRPKWRPAPTMSFARNSKVALPSLIRSPGARPSRSNRRSGAAAPYIPSRAGEEVRPRQSRLGERATRRADRRRRPPSLRPEPGRNRPPAAPSSACRRSPRACPDLSRKANSGGVASRWLSSKRMSPPSSACPSAATPDEIARATEPTPPIAATPSAMQVRKMRKPDSPPRISRKAKRSASRSGSRALTRIPAMLARRAGDRLPSKRSPDAGASPRSRSVPTAWISAASSGRRAPDHG